ncbi:LacI family transcriptional regulator [Bacillus freudenreichii]|nr:LacI family transcriptional regulator [Bacillus freudenreichii]
MSITIKDVAKHAGVSKATVSRVINHNTSVNKEIKERVLASIEELGYQPNAIARSLANSTSNVIGLILPDIVNPYFPALARGIEDSAHEHGYSLFISNTDNNPDIEQEYIEKMCRQQVGGIILISSILDEEKVNKLVELGVPFVLCDRLIENSQFDTVSIDNYKAAYEAVLRLIRQGYEKIYHLSGPKHIQPADKRRQAYIDAMHEHGLEPMYQVGDFSYKSGYERMKSVLEKSKISAVFAANDLIALGAMSAIHEKGLTIPNDISVIGCDDILFAQMSNPKLSTISVPAYKIGATAVKLLVDRIKGVRSKSKNLILNHKFIERES